MKTAVKYVSASLFIFLICTFLYVPKAEAYVLLGVKWPGSKQRIPIYASTSLSMIMPMNNAIAAIQRSINTWNNSGYSNFTFYYAGTTTITQAANDDKNIVTAYNQNSPFRYGESFCDNHVVGNWINGSDYIFYKYDYNGYAVDWRTNSPIWPTQSDFEGALNHELGHGFGLDHSQVPQAVMGSACGRGCTGNRILHSDDIAGIQALYGRKLRIGLSGPTSVRDKNRFSFNINLPRSGGLYYGILMSFSPPPSSGYAMSNFTSNDTRVLESNSNWFPVENFNNVFFFNFWGRLSSSGRATASVQLPTFISLSGHTMYFSYITLGTAIGGIDDVGDSYEVAITP